jgi:hypothetical protein
MIRRPIAALPFLLLAACAGQPSEPMVTKVPSTPPGGLWEVTAAMAIEPSSPAVASPYLGQKMMLATEVAGDPTGRMCKNPLYQGWDSTPERVLGNAWRGGETRSDAVRPVLDVSCEGLPFGAYLPQPDGSLLSRVNNWVLTLNRAPEPPKPVPPPVVAVAPPVPLMPEPEPVKPLPAAPALEKRTLVYLASYKNENSAHKGWEQLARSSPILAAQKPMTQMIDLGKKGKWVRLYGMANDDAERTTLCKQLGKLVDECGARNRE